MKTRRKTHFCKQLYTGMFSISKQYKSGRSLKALTTDTEVRKEQPNSSQCEGESTAERLREGEKEEQEKEKERRKEKKTAMFCL